MCHTLFENIDYPLVGLDLVGIDDTNEPALERSTHFLYSTWLTLTMPIYSMP